MKTTAITLISGKMFSEAVGNLLSKYHSKTIKFLCNDSLSSMVE